MGIRKITTCLMALAVMVAGLVGCSTRTAAPLLAQQPSMDHKRDFYVAHKGIDDGYEIIFHIMPAPEGDGLSRVNYHLMVSVEQDGVVVTDLQLNSKVKHPDGTVQQQDAMMRMGNWYMALYNLSHEMGRHWVSVSFDHAGKHYTSGIYYPERVYTQ